MANKDGFKLGKQEANNRAALPMRLSVGRTNIRVTDDSSAASLGRGLNAAFGELVENFRWYVNQLEGFLPEDMLAAMQPTFEKSQEWCPKDKGTLVESGYLEVESFRGSIRVEMGYGRNDSPDYAIYVHEMVDFHHEEPTRAKWLQAAVDEDYYKIIQEVTDRIKIRVGG